MPKEPQKVLSIRLTAQEYQALRQIAKAESRFVSRQAAYLIKCALRENDNFCPKNSKEIREGI